ncbi:hypothetical protein ACFSUS_26500 [Spirosoma soli]|uniref:Uncharacterized protein n=1 Tax=Spirosoma soli TaxID=1770529 RepID=A0ABW5MDC8_9BACT
MNIWRITGVALLAGLALFLVTILLKLLLIAAVVAVILRVVGGRLAGRMFGPMGRGRFAHSNNIISIDNPSYRYPMNRAGFERVIPIN